MIVVLFIDEQVILAATATMPNAMSMMNFATLHRTAPTRFLPQKLHTTKPDLVQGINVPTLEGTDHIPSITVPDMGNISAGHSPAAVPTIIEAVVSEDTPCTPHLATVAALATHLLMDAPITTHAMTPSISQLPCETTSCNS